MASEREDQDEPTQPQERTAFHGQSASDCARQHNGNVNNSECPLVKRYRDRAMLIAADYAYQYTVKKRRSDDTLREDQRNKQLLKAVAA